MQTLTETDVDLIKWVGGGVLTLVTMLGSAIVYIRKEFVAASNQRKADEEAAVTKALRAKQSDKRARIISKRLRVMQDAIGKVEKELTFNGGGSMKDLVAALRAELQFETGTRRITEHRALAESIVLANGVVQPIAISQAWSRITGLTMDDMRANGWQRCVAVGDRLRVQALFDHAHTAATVFEAEYDLVHAITGTPARVRHTAYPIHNTTHKLIGWVGELVTVS